ncbi:MAG: hypothetical protein P8176_14470 [Gammaproteobacteria bacterium]
MRFAVLDAIFERNNKVERKNKVEGKNNAQRIALVGDTVSLTYAELATAINTLADAFVAARTQHLGILCDNSPHWISALKLSRRRHADLHITRTGAIARQ